MSPFVHRVTNRHVWWVTTQWNRDSRRIGFDAHHASLSASSTGRRAAEARDVVARTVERPRDGWIAHGRGGGGDHVAHGRGRGERGGERGRRRERRRGRGHGGGGDGVVPRDVHGGGRDVHGDGAGGGVGGGRGDARGGGVVDGGETISRTVGGDAIAVARFRVRSG